MLEIEHAKAISFSIAGFIAHFSAFPIGQLVPEGLDKWIERGGTGLCIVFLLLAIRAEKAARDERQKRLDDMHDRELQSTMLKAQSEEKLANALDKLTDAVNRK